MLKKTLVSSAIISALLFSLATVQAAEMSHSPAMPADSMQMSESKAPMMTTSNMDGMAHNTSVAVGEIIGDFNSPDGTVVGATLPGKEVKFSLPMNGKQGEYLHFAVMHAASASQGWYFAPTSETGINLSGLKFSNHKPLDITQYIGLFQAANANQSSKVTADHGALKHAASDKFLQVTVIPKQGQYWVTIKNISNGAYQTPISSGVWGLSNQAEKSFDHTPSAALSALATAGHRDALFQSVQNR